MYRAHPNAWKVKTVEKRPQVLVCFRWQLLGAQAVPACFTEQRNDHARVRALTRPGSLAALAKPVPCIAWCARALEALQKAANDFVGRCEPALLREFGLKVQCTYAT